MVAVPWPSAEGEGTWQQYVAVPVENLVSRIASHTRQCKQERGQFKSTDSAIKDADIMQKYCAGACEGRGVT